MCVGGVGEGVRGGYFEYQCSRYLDCLMFIGTLCGEASLSCFYLFCPVWIGGYPKVL